MKARLSLLAGAFALAACGSATDSVTFKPPASYHSKASFGPFVQLWESAPHNEIVLLSFPVQTDLNKAMSQSELKDARFQKKERIKICDGSQEAVFAVAEGQSKVDSSDPEPRPSEVEFLATNVEGKTYLAMYARPLHSPADTAAEAAIRNICPK